MYIFQCSSSVARSGFNFFIDRGVGRRNWREDILSSMIKSKGRMNWKHWLVWSFLIPSHFRNYCFHEMGFYFLTDQLQINSKKHLRTARDPQCNLNSLLTGTISLGFFGHFSAHLPLDNSNFSLTRTKFRFTLIQIYPDYSNSGCIIIAQKSQRSIFKFVKNQWNVSHDSLIHSCSLSASWFGKKKNTFLGVIILMFLACALRHCRVMTGHYVTLKYQAKARIIAWKVSATLKWLDSTIKTHREWIKMCIWSCGVPFPRATKEVGDVCTQARFDHG